METFTYRDLLSKLPDDALDQPVRVFLRDVGTWASVAAAAPVHEVDSQGELNGEVPDDDWILSTR